MTSQALPSLQSADSASTPAQLTPMLKQYQEQKQAHPDCLLFFRLGDFYELFFEDAITASKILQITLTQRGKHGDNPIPMCGVPFHAYENYVKKLIDAGHRVAICEQTETPEARSKNGNKGPLTRNVVRIMTAATVVEENLLDARVQTFLMAASLSDPTAKHILPQTYLTCAFLDLAGGDFFIETTTVEQFLSLLEQYHPKEVLIPDGLYEIHCEKLRFMGNRILPLPKAKFDGQNARRRLQDFYGIATLDSIGDLCDGDLCASAIVLDYVETTQKQAMPTLPFPKKRIEHKHLLIDQHTRRNLEIHMTTKGEREGSLLHALDRTQTSAGARLLHHYVSTPLLDLEIMNKRLDRIAFFIEKTVLSEKCRKVLSRNADIARSTTRLCMDKGGPRDLGVVTSALETAQHLQTLLSGGEDGAVPFSPPPLPEELFHELTHALSDSLPLLTRDGGFIRDGYDAELDTIRAFERDATAHLNALQERLKLETGISSLKIKFNGILGYFLECPPSQKDKIPPSFIPRQELSTGLRYSTPELNAMASNIMGAGEKALAQEIHLFENLRQKVNAEQQKLMAIAHFIATVDVATSMATLAIEKNYCRPKLTSSKDLWIEEGRHPVLDSPIFEPNDVVFDEKQRFIVLTGPNMAGKSTYLRQVALITLMAQCGFYVPAKRAKIGLVDRIFSRIGAGDDLASGRSTFMVEMVETATILNQATDRSLVILDELGRGTSTYDGLSLAWSVIEHLESHTRARCLFATHYFELTDLEKSLPTLTNARMAIKEYEGNIIFLHKVEKGSANSSYGLHVAALSGVPQGVIDRAKEILLYLSKGQPHMKPERRTQLVLNLAPTTPQKPAVSLKEAALVEAIGKIDLNSLTPIAALNFLHELKNKH